MSDDATVFERGGYSINVTLDTTGRVATLRVMRGRNAVTSYKCAVGARWWLGERSIGRGFRRAVQRIGKEVKSDKRTTLRRAQWSRDAAREIHVACEALKEHVRLRG